MKRFPKGNKYFAKGQWFENLYFHSTAELNRWKELLLLEKAKEISDLKRQVKFDLIVTGPTGEKRKVAGYKMDFVYKKKGGSKLVAEEKKGFETEESKIKMELFQLLYPEYEFIKS